MSFILAYKVERETEDINGLYFGRMRNRCSVVKY